MRYSNLFVNPLNNPNFAPIAVTLVILFGAAALLLQVQALVPNTSAKLSSNSKRQVLWQRYRSWAIIAPVYALSALCGPLTVVALCAFLAWQAGNEYTHLTSLLATQRALIIAQSWLTLIAVLIFGGNALLYALPIAFFASSALGLVPQSDTQTLENRYQTMLNGLYGYLYTGWLPAHLLALSGSKFSGLVLVVGLGVAMSDVGAFCTGKAIGGPKLAPKLSPNKTWGGIIGNLLGALLAVMLLGFVLPVGLEIWQRVVLALVIGIGSVWGDLLESLLKRQSGVKDAGNLLPGFGGLLDRIDSLLLVAPLVWYFVTLLG